jgi:hypothetical protein
MLYFMRNRSTRFELLKAALYPVLSLVVTVCGAETSGKGSSKLFDAVAFHAARGVDHNLLEIPGSAIGGGLKWEDSWFESVSVSRTLGPLGARHAWLAASPLGSWREGYELVLVRHRGRQENAEIGLAYQVRTPAWTLGPAQAALSLGVGLSQALGTPTYEDGPDGDPSRRYRLQMLALFETEWWLRDLDAWSMTVRVHHRSGVYGLIAPPRVGSNFIAVGLRKRF